MENALKTKLAGLPQDKRTEYATRVFTEGAQTEYAQLIELVLDQAKEDTQATLLLQHGRDGASNCVFLSGILQGIEQVRQRLFPRVEREIEEIEYE
jgi:hypothetical protein